MNEPASITPMTAQDRQISEIIADERSRLRNFIRRRVLDPSDVEDILQEVFFELMEANQGARQIFAHTHLVRGGSVMVKPTNEWLGRAYPPRQRWVIDAVAFAGVPADPRHRRS